jgi:hypothetical protein
MIAGIRRLVSVAFVMVAVGESFACGGTPAAPSNPLNSPPDHSTVTRLSDVLDDRPLGGMISGDGLPLGSTDSEGRAFVRSETPGAIRIAVTAPGYFERQTGLAVPGAPADISLIPTTLELVTYDQLARLAVDSEGRQSIRWTVAPRLVVYTRLLDCSQNAPDEIRILASDIPERATDEAVFTLRRALQAFSGELFSDFLDVKREKGEIGERRILRDSSWAGVIHAGACQSLANWGRDVDGGAAVTFFSAPFVIAGGIALWKADLVGLRRPQVQMHELGHTLGLGHASTPVASIMSVTAPTWDISAFDRQAGRILHRRPPGNRTPDVDPPGFTINGTLVSKSSSSPRFSPSGLAWTCGRGDRF